MRLIIDIVLLLIMALCIWSGYKRGIIRSAAGFAAIILTLVISSVVASGLARELVPAVEPFIGGFVESDSTTEAVLDNLGYGTSDKSLTDILTEDSSLRYDYAYECLRETGFFKEVAEDLAGDAVNYADKNNISMTDSVITVVCNSAAYVLCVTVVFILIMVLFSALMDMLNLNIRLPNADLVDDVGGAAIGFLKGFLICILICWLLGFLGLIIGRSTADKTGLLRFFQAFRFITRTLI